MKRVGVLMGFAESDPKWHSHFAAFQTALRELGWADGRNVMIASRWTAADPDPSAYAAELVAGSPDVILACPHTAAVAMARQTHSIPIVAVISGDPVRAGFVQSYARPGGNVTALSGGGEKCQQNRSPAAGDASHPKTSSRPLRRSNNELRSREHLTETEVEKLIEAAKSNRHGHRDATMVLVAYRHGLRASEICDLRWDQIDFTSATLHVRRVKMESRVHILFAATNCGRYGS